MESQFLKRIRDKYDFADYKTLVANDKTGQYVDLLDMDFEEAFMTPENTFAQVSSDIDLYYSFNDEMVQENLENGLWGMTIDPTFEYDQMDDDYDTPYTYY